MPPTSKCYTDKWLFRWEGPASQFTRIGKLFEEKTSSGKRGLDSLSTKAANQTILLHWKQVVSYNSVDSWIRIALQKVANTWAIEPKGDITQGNTTEPMRKQTKVSRKARVPDQVRNSETDAAPAQRPRRNPVASLPAPSATEAGNHVTVQSSPLATEAGNPWNMRPEISAKGADNHQDVSRPPVTSAAAAGLSWAAEDAIDPWLPWLVAAQGRVPVEEILERFQAQYRFAGPLAEGASSIVQKIVRIADNRMMVCKTTRAGVLKPSQIFQEVVLLNSCRHPNIVELVDVFMHKALAREGATPLVACHQIFEDAGLPLSECCKDKGLPIEQIQSIASQCLAGLARLHLYDIVHNDLKPPNILVDGSKVRLADLGVAFVDREGSMVPTPAGTIWYRPPEALLKSPRVQTSLDIWAMGCVMVEISQGQDRLPFEETTLWKWSRPFLHVWGRQLARPGQSSNDGQVGAGISSHRLPRHGLIQSG